MKPTLILPALLLCFAVVSAQDLDRKIQFPDVHGYKTLKCDFHIHTVFSDGQVWPNIRIEEALRDGLDAISLTEHIEYQPHKDDLPHPDRNRSFEVAKEYIKPYDLLLIHGAEITRRMPPGHANALFIQDVNAFKVGDSLESYKLARKQGAFIFWNHPNWIAQRKDGVATLTDFHKKLISQDLLHGIEVVNDITFSEDAMKIAQEQNLTVMGTSDIHGLVDYQFNLSGGGHRPVTLVLAREKTEASIKEALFAGRTVAWFDNVLVGKEPHLKLLLDSCLLFKNKGFIGDSKVLEVEIKNQSDARFILKNNSKYVLQRQNDLVEILPHSTKTIQVITAKGNTATDPLEFTVLNAVNAYRQNAVVKFELK